MLGEHVKQAGSLVAPDRLRFDFSHYAPLTDEQIDEIERIVNAETLANTPVRAFETTKAEAEAMGAIAFFGDKYGDIVRVLEAGPSLEFCGGTHVRATGDIGTVKIVSEGSIGSNLRRIEAVTGDGSVALLQRDERVLAEAARLVGVPADELVEGVQRKLDEARALADEVKALRARLASGRAGELAASATDGVVIDRVDGLAADELRELALAVRNVDGHRDRRPRSARRPPVASASSPPCSPGWGSSPPSLIRDAARAVGGGGGGKGDVATAGGKDPAGIDEALRIAAEGRRRRTRLGGVVAAMRALGLDLGTKRIGVAVSDRSGTLASPLTVIERGRSRAPTTRGSPSWCGPRRPSASSSGCRCSLSGGRRTGRPGCPDGGGGAGYRGGGAGRDPRRAVHHGDGRAQPGRGRRARPGAPPGRRQGRRGGDPPVLARRRGAGVAT